MAGLTFADSFIPPAPFYSLLFYFESICILIKPPCRMVDISSSPSPWSFSSFLLHSSSHSIDSIIVACLRRVQEWSFVSILGELRMHSGCRQFDVEQFIESFNPDIIDISQNTPDYLLIHMRLKVSCCGSDLQWYLSTTNISSQMSDWIKVLILVFHDWKCVLFCFKWDNT